MFFVKNVYSMTAVCKKQLGDVPKSIKVPPLVYYLVRAVSSLEPDLGKAVVSDFV